MSKDARSFVVLMKTKGKMSTQTMIFENTEDLSDHEIVSREEWLIARKDLLKREKELTRLRDQLAAERRALPWVTIDKKYVFDAPEGEVTLAELFDGRSQLFIKHFMLGPGQKTQCVGCSLEVDHIDGILPHLENHDVTLRRSRARADRGNRSRAQTNGLEIPLGLVLPLGFQLRLQCVLDAQANRFGSLCLQLRGTAEWAAHIEDLSGNSVFYKDETGQIFHTYSTFGRGGEEFLGIYRFLDTTPKGRNENGPYHSLTDWARPRNMYGKGGEVEANGRFHQPACACQSHEPAPLEGIS